MSIVSPKHKGLDMPKTNHRTSLFVESIIRRMTRLANIHGAINLE
jgi:hypothetical protein